MAEIRVAKAVAMAEIRVAKAVAEVVFSTKPELRAAATGLNVLFSSKPELRAAATGLNVLFSRRAIFSTAATLPMLQASALAGNYALNVNATLPMLRAAAAGGSSRLNVNATLPMLQASALAGNYALNVNATLPMLQASALAGNYALNVNATLPMLRTYVSQLSPKGADMLEMLPSYYADNTHVKQIMQVEGMELAGMQNVVNVFPSIGRPGDCPSWALAFWEHSLSLTSHGAWTVAQRRAAILSQLGSLVTLEDFKAYLSTQTLIPASEIALSYGTALLVPGGRLSEVDVNCTTNTVTWSNLVVPTGSWPVLFRVRGATPAHTAAGKIQLILDNFPGSARLLLPLPTFGASLPLGDALVRPGPSGRPNTAADYSGLVVFSQYLIPSALRFEGATRKGIYLSPSQEFTSAADHTTIPPEDYRNTPSVVMTFTTPSPSASDLARQARAQAILERIKPLHFA